MRAAHVDSERESVEVALSDEIERAGRLSEELVGPDPEGLQDMGSNALMSRSRGTDDSSMAERSARASRRSSTFALGFAHRTYFRLLSRAAHAWGTPESAVLLPGMTAQPPFST